MKIFQVTYYMEDGSEQRGIVAAKTRASAEKKAAVVVEILVTAKQEFTLAELMA